ncbi:hypothetical protein OCM00_03115 [Klebsiella pneumoniae]|nr:hypothetical protein OCM00_03115 [Klebsiella pneumoniae]
MKRYREHGPLSLVNRRRSQPGNRQLRTCTAYYPRTLR